MQVIRAEAMGMCFGVRDAIAITEAITNPSEVTIHGELVHNEQVNQRLAQRGFASNPEVSRNIPNTPAVMITAHGVSNHERVRLASAGKTLLDTTCPLVRRAHDTATQVEADGYHVVVAGKRNHVEVLGLTGDLDNYTIIQDSAEARPLPYHRLGVICQTTMQPSMADAIAEALRLQNPDSEVRLFNTICRPTRERQLAMADLVQRCEAIVVVGGERSNNTLQLVRLAEQHNKPACRVNSAGEIDLEWAAQFKVIGLTAGTSTPDSIINAVAEKLESIEPHNADINLLPPILPDGLVPSNIWVQWFEWNAANQPDLPWDSGDPIPAQNLAVVAPSLQEFQRGESSEGRHFLTRGFRHAIISGDSDYYEALRLFIAEENRHGEYLGQFLQRAGVPLLKATPSDNLFRALRRIGGLEGAICILLTAEIIACTYYRAIAHATGSPVLKAICRQILRDEYKHLRFQNERLMILRAHRPPLFRDLTFMLQAVLLCGAIIIIWPKHGSAIRTGGYTFGTFFRETFAVFFRQIVNLQIASSVSLFSIWKRRAAQ